MPKKPKSEKKPKNPIKEQKGAKKIKADKKLVKENAKKLDEVMPSKDDLGKHRKQMALEAKQASPESLDALEAAKADPKNPSPNPRAYVGGEEPAV